MHVLHEHESACYDCLIRKTGNNEGAKMSETYNVETTIETGKNTGTAQYFGLTAREIETLKRTIRETVPAGSAVDVKVTERRG